VRRAARADGNQRALTQALRRLGASVHLTHTVGQGFPDAVVGFRGENYLIEFKIEGGELTGDEPDWHAAWRGQVAVVRSLDDALQVLGIDEH